MNVIAIFDVGKTNKKLLLFDEQYRFVAERSVALDPMKDEEGDSCEDLRRLTRWVRESVALELARNDLRIVAFNFSAYGASFVHIGENGQPVAPLYNYLKPYPERLKSTFYEEYGGEERFSLLTASPVLGSLNSGMQLYRIRRERPELFARIKYSLHLPQYLSYLLTGRPVSDITSIGCHTNLWDFSRQRYHEWVSREGLIDKLAPIVDSTTVYPVGPGDGPVVGVGLHDSSAAVIPYLASFSEPFALISTGTWCITMNPFNDSPLTVAELRQDCLCYMSYRGQPVKASRLFAGRDHDQQVRRIAAHFHRSPAFAAIVAFDAACVGSLLGRREAVAPVTDGETADGETTGGGTAGGQATGGGAADGEAMGGEAVAPVKASAFGKRHLDAFGSFEEAYHCLLMDIMDQQALSARLVLRDAGVSRIFVDGGFGRNQVYMHLLASAFPGTQVCAASIPQASAMGAALAIHGHWNRETLPADLIELKRYKPYR